MILTQPSSALVARRGNCTQRRAVYCYTNLTPCKQEMFAPQGQGYVYVFTIKAQGMWWEGHRSAVWEKPVPSGKAWSFLGGDFIALTFIYLWFAALYPV